MTEKPVLDRTEVSEASPSPAGDRVPRVTAIAGPGAGRAVAVSRAVATVGRHATNDLVLTDPRVSGVHLELGRIGERLRVRDGGSTNGTWVGGWRVGEIELGPGAELTVGDTLLRIDLDASGTASVIRRIDSFGSLVGASPAAREIFSTLERVSGKPLNLLFQGEAGTGKEEMARAVVAASTRSASSLVVVDVTSFPEALAEAVLFGEERAAGGSPSRGQIEAASGGTVFLDEVGGLSPVVQSKLLRVLERQELTRAGGHAPVKVDVRVLAATSKDLRHEIEHGRFREDLYLRLAQVRVFVPPLRDRPEDVAPLCRRFLESAGAAAMTIDVDAAEELARHPWPGNVRELRYTVERAAAFAQDGVIRRSDIAGEGFGFRGAREEREALDLSGSFKDAKERAVERFESAYLTALMRRCQGNVSHASREADLARHHLRDLLKKRELYGVSWDGADE